MDVFTAFNQCFSQERRLINLRFNASAPADTLLVPQRIVFEEAISQAYTADVVALSLDPAMPLKTLVGHAAAVDLIGKDGSRRVITGIVTRIWRFGEDGGLTCYGLRIQSALSPLSLRRSSRYFRNKSTPDIAIGLLQEHIHANPAIAASLKIESRLRRQYPARSLVGQFNESDTDFIKRLLAEDGINFVFTFDDSGDSPTHTIVLFDDSPDLPESPIRTLQYHGQDDLSSTLLDWQAERQLISTLSALASFDYKPARVKQSTDPTLIDQGERGNQAGASLEDYRAQTLYYATDQGELDQYARLRQQAHDLKAKTFHGNAIEALRAGEWFQLEGHPAHVDDSDAHRQFVVIGQCLEATNNLPSDLVPYLPDRLLQCSNGFAVSASASSLRDERLQSRFRAVRRYIPIVPDYADALQRPTAPGPQTAIVVGPAGEEVHTDELGRVFVQFHWQRTDEHPDGGADFDERSCTPIRVCTPHAGAGFGQSFLPRIGEEVVIFFLDSDIDRPLIQGGIHNGNTLPPAFSNQTGYPGNRALSGLVSREHGGAGFNELLMDDTAGQVRTRVASTHADSELNLGYLTTPRKDGKAEPRGEGVELRTDAAAAIRAARGLLFSTFDQLNAQGRQLDRSELMTLVTACTELCTSLSDYVAQHGGGAMDTEPQQTAAKALSAWEGGSNTQPDNVEEGGQPLLALAARAALLQCTPKVHITYAGQNIDSIAEHHVQLTSGQYTRVHAGHGIDLFAQSNGIRAIANRGPVTIQAQDDQIDIAAEKQLRVASNGDEVLVTGKIIRFVADDGSYITIGLNGIDFGTPGYLRYKSGAHQIEGPAQLSREMNQWSNAPFDERVKFVSRRGNPAADHRYDIRRSDGAIIKGVTDAQGWTELQQGVSLENAKVTWRGRT